MGRSIYTCSLVAALTLFGSNSVSSAEEIDTIIRDVSEYWSPVIEDGEVQTPIDISTEVLGDHVAPAQMLAPQRDTSNRVAQRPGRSGGRRGSSGLSKVPFMIGDTGAGTCFAFRGLLEAELSHPTLTCSRLNISENNTPLPTDRLYFSYRHFHNASNLRYYQFKDSFDVDRFTFGGEKTFADGLFSFEMRVPLENRISSNRESYDVFDPPVFFDPNVFAPGFNPFGGGERVELANISFMLKALLYETESCAISAGLGVTLPTASDVEYLVTTDNDLVFPTVPGVLAQSSILLDVFGSNETVYLSPFLSWLKKEKGSRFFHQGFLQVEVAANPSSIATAGAGLTNFFDPNGAVVDPNTGATGIYDWFTPFPTGRSDLFAQTLMRLNLGFGYDIIDDPRASFFQRLTGMMEFHYTGTLNDANLSSVPISFTTTGDTGGVIPGQELQFGNLLGRVDIVNMVLGLSANCNGWVITNGVTAPIYSSEWDNPFDFEYNLQIQKPF